MVEGAIFIANGLTTFAAGVTLLGGGTVLSITGIGAVLGGAAIAVSLQAVAAGVVAISSGGGIMYSSMNNFEENLSKAQKAQTSKVDDVKLKEDIKELDNGIRSTKPNQVHHFATNKSKRYTKQFENIANKYNLDLDDLWNKELMPHQGRHPYAYHEYVLREMTKYDNIARGDKNKFLKLYEQLKNKVINNPDMLTKDYWK